MQEMKGCHYTLFKMHGGPGEHLEHMQVKSVNIVACRSYGSLWVCEMFVTGFADKLMHTTFFQYTFWQQGGQL